VVAHLHEESDEEDKSGSSLGYFCKPRCNCDIKIYVFSGVLAYVIRSSSPSLACSFEGSHISQ